MLTPLSPEAAKARVLMDKRSGIQRPTECERFQSGLRPKQLRNRYHGGSAALAAQFIDLFAVHALNAVLPMLYQELSNSQRAYQRAAEHKKHDPRSGAQPDLWDRKDLCRPKQQTGP